MFRKYTLQTAVSHQQPLEFEWNPESGEVRGPDADMVIRLAETAVKEGGIIGHPIPTSYEITDPLHKIEEMAVLLGQDWVLSDDLAGAYPSAEEEHSRVIVIDKNGVEHDLSGQMLH